jgi:hypothetical protein
MTLIIETFSDTAALKLLYRYVAGATGMANIDGGAGTSVPPVDLRTLLQGVPGAHATGTERPSEGDIAREALKLLSQNDQTAARLAELEAAPAPKQFVDPVTMVMTGALALSILQLAGYVSYDKSSGWRFRVEKKAASDAVLLAFVRKVLAKFGG